MAKGENLESTIWRRRELNRGLLGVLADAPIVVVVVAAAAAMVSNASNNATMSMPSSPQRGKV